MSARPYVELAVQAGYEVAAIDGFADVQTRALCRDWMTVPFDARGFEAAALIQALQQFDMAKFDGFVYGSGFESQPELLHQIQTWIPVLGNDATTVASVKTPKVFFAALEQFGILFPDWYCVRPEMLQDVLLKNAGGSGGMHIQHAQTASHDLDSASYFQRKIEGESVSVLFLANGQTIDVIGFNLQWLSATEHTPFRIGGVAGNADLSEAVKSKLRYAAETLTRHFGLLGLNSLDAMVSVSGGMEQVWVLELNPRMSASVDAYVEQYPDMFERHILSCHDLSASEKTLKILPFKAHGSCAFTVVYADVDLNITAGFVWPAWVKDNPSLGSQGLEIKAGEPVCTVHAVAENAEEAKKMAQQRAVAILELLKQQHLF